MSERFELIEDPGSAYGDEYWACKECGSAAVDVESGICYSCDDPDSWED